VDEADLGRVPSAAEAAKAANAASLGGAPPSAYKGAASSGYEHLPTCDPSNTTFLDCVSTDLSLPHAGRVLLVAGGGQNSFGESGEGTCEFRIDGALSTAPAVRPGEPTPQGTDGIDNTSQDAQNGFSMTTVTESLGPGEHTFALACNERVGEVEMLDTTISAVLAE
jgi:hypothetical protein